MSLSSSISISKRHKDRKCKIRSSWMHWITPLGNSI